MTFGAFACSSSPSSPGSAGSADASPVDGSAPDAEGPADAGPSVLDGGTVDAAGPVAWMAGGTAGLAAQYPSPFTGLGGRCELSCAQTLGPCYVTSARRQDISEGYPGLPMRLLVRVVRADGCRPVTDAEVDVWHTDHLGVYSGPTPSTICNPSARNVSGERFFRGLQPTDDDGVAAFDTVLPGWYPGRTAHIHYTIRTPGAQWLTSQLYFDPGLTAEIYAEHPDYATRGPASVTNATDGLIADGAILDWRKTDDGALLCSTTVVLRDAIDDPAC